MVRAGCGLRRGQPFPPTKGDLVRDAKDGIVRSRPQALGFREGKDQWIRATGRQMGDAVWQEYLLGPRKFCIRLGLKAQFSLFQWISYPVLEFPGKLSGPGSDILSLVFHPSSIPHLLPLRIPSIGNPGPTSPQFPVCLTSPGCSPQRTD